jgi:hypothetical protein
VWWQCGSNPTHEWITDVGTRTRAETGCPSCAEYGYDPAKPAWLYLIEQPELELLQVGISNNLTVRFGAHRSREWVRLDERGPMDGGLAPELEQGMLTKIRRSGASFAPAEEFRRFSGYTETSSARSFPVSTLSDLLGSTSANL